MQKSVGGGSFTLREKGVGSTTLPSPLVALQLYSPMSDSVTFLILRVLTTDWERLGRRAPMTVMVVTVILPPGKITVPSLDQVKLGSGMPSARHWKLISVL